MKIWNAEEAQREIDEIDRFWDKHGGELPVRIQKILLQHKASAEWVIKSEKGGS